MALMTRSAAHPVDYAHLPGEEHNPLMESTLHVDWTVVLVQAARHALAATDHLVTGNVALDPGDGGPYTAPDVMVIPGQKGRHFGRYELGPANPLPSVCVEILSPSNTRPSIQRRTTRLLRLGVEEVYVLDPIRDGIVRVTLDGDERSETDAVGTHSPGLGLSFVRVDGHLALCCPAGRVVHPGDDPFGWLTDEMSRADAESARADSQAARADAEASRADAEASRADAEAARAKSEAARSATAIARAEAAEAELARLRALE